MVAEDAFPIARLEKSVAGCMRRARGKMEAFVAGRCLFSRLSSFLYRKYVGCVGLKEGCKSDVERCGRLSSAKMATGCWPRVESVRKRVGKEGG